MEQNMVYRISKLVGDNEKKAGVILEAILDDLEECSSKVGKFVRGKLTDKEDTLELKVWDTTLDNFKNKTGIEGACLVQLTGDFDFYNGQAQFVMKPTNNTIKAVKSSNDINNYVDSSKYDGKKIFNGLLKAVDEHIQTKELNRLAKMALTFEPTKLVYFPYSSKHHTEKGGLISHLYYTFRMALTQEGYAYPFNKEIILTAILCSRLAAFYRYDVDEVTGKIKEQNELQKALFCQMDNVMLLNQLIDDVMRENAKEAMDACEDEDKKREAYNEVMMNRPQALTHVLHCVSCVYGKTSPATPEALMTRSFIKNEIKSFEMMKKKKTLANGETAVIRVFNEELKVIGGF